MCDEFDAGLDSVDSDIGVVDDFSADDISTTMDESPILEDNIDSFDDFGEVEAPVEDSSVMDIMDDTSVDMSDEVFEDDMLTESEDMSLGDGLEDEEIESLSMDTEPAIDDIENSDIVEDEIIASENDMDNLDDASLNIGEGEITENFADDSLIDDSELNDSFDDMEADDTLDVSDDQNYELEDNSEITSDSVESNENFDEVVDENITEETGEDNFEEFVSQEETFGEDIESVQDDNDTIEETDDVIDEVASEGTEEDEIVPETQQGFEETEGSLDNNAEDETIETQAEQNDEIVEEQIDNNEFSEDDNTQEVGIEDEMESGSEFAEPSDEILPENTDENSESPEESAETEQIGNVDAIEEAQENSALDSMSEYMSEHNYGPDDFETYSQDPEWQQLNNDLLEADGRDPIDYGEGTETSPLDSMSEYMSEHNYGPDDFETYSQDPEWQQLNNDLLEADGRNPIDYVEQNETSAMDSMTDYMYEHNYGRDDFETYSQDPEWQQLNNDLLAEMGREPIDYGDDTENITEIPATDDNTEIEQSVSDIMDSVDVPDSEPLDSFSEGMDENRNPESSVEEWMDETEIQDTTDALEPDDLKEPETIESLDSFIDIEHNNEYTESLLENRPELAEMFENGEFYEQGNNENGFEGTCGETTQANTLNRLLGTNEITENDVLNVAIDKNLCEVDPLNPANSGGTSTEQFMDLYNEMNHRSGDKLDVELFDYEDALSIDEMASRLENGSVLNIAVDSNELWDLPADITDTAHYTDHWISVTGVDRDATGNISGFKIVDSGGGENYLDIDKFERCYYGNDDNPVIDPTCIVVSRKGK